MFIILHSASLLLPLCAFCDFPMAAFTPADSANSICILSAICLCPICFTSSHLHSLPLMMKLDHTAALFKRHLPSNFIRQPAQLFADAFGLFLVTMHDGILERCAAEATLRQRRTRRYLPRRSRACVAGRWSSARKHPQASSLLIASIVSSLCGIAIVSTSSTGFAPRRFSYPRYCCNLLWQPCLTL